MIWNETKECMSRDELVDLQSKRLVELVNRMYSNAEYYRKKMQAIGLEPEDIKGIEDITKLPFTTQEDLRENCPYGVLAVPKAEIIRYQSSSGTTGIETVVGYTRKDIDIWSECVARCITMAGLGVDDTIQVAYNYGMFTGGLGAHYGAEKVGAAVVPTSICNTGKMINIMQKLDVTGIMCTPSYLRHIAEEIDDRGLKSKINLKAALCGAEPWSEAARKDIEDLTGIKAYDIYGLSEVSGPGVACECECQKGLHIQEDYFVPEVIDSDTFESVSEGTEGELCFTTLKKEGAPLIRYRTGDISKITYEKCECGRTFARLARLKGRTDDMLIIRGMNVYPQQIVKAFDAMNYPNVRYMLRVSRIGSLDSVELLVEFESDFNMQTEMDELFEKARKIVKQTTGLVPKIEIVEQGSIKAGNSKKIVVVDTRKFDLDYKR